MAELDDKVIVTKDKITTIADTIRETGGTSARMTLDEMPDNIRAIGEGGGNVDAPLFVCVYPNTVTCNLTFAKIEEIYAGTGDTKASMPQLIYKHSSSSDNGTRSVYCDVTQYDEDTFIFTFNMGYGKGVNQTQWQERIIEIQFERGDSLSKINDYTLEYQKPVVAGDGIELENVGTGINRKTQISVADALTIINESNGSVASISDGGANMPMKSCLIGIEPVQSGSGDPSPSNVRPISGWTECNVTRDNKNLFDSELLLGASGWQKDANGVYYGNNTNMYSYSNNNDIWKFHKDGYSYTFKCQTKCAEVGKELIFDFKYSDGTHTYGRANATDTDLHEVTMTSNSAKTLVEFVISYSSSGTCYIKNAQMEIGTTATTYEPYKGQNYNIQFPSQVGTVYGGTLDVTNGVLTVDRAVVLGGDLTWQKSSDGGNKYIARLQTNLYKWASDIFVICDSYKNDGIGNSTRGYYGADGTFRYYYSQGATAIPEFYVTDDNQTSLSDFEAAIENVKFVYELATPTTYNLTPTEIKTLLGINNIFADCGDIDVEYVRDATSIINWLISQINLGA